MSGSGNGWDNSYYTNSGRETFDLFGAFRKSGRILKKKGKLPFNPEFRD
jgi:hypothetical protein